MTEGDEIWMFHGGVVPVVLRRYGEENESIMAQYSPSILEDDETADNVPESGRRSASGNQDDGSEDGESFPRQEGPVIVEDDKYKDNGSDIGRYNLIGECYLHGYMYGKMLEEDEKMEENLVPLILV
jgi:hypothetical protein